MRAMTVLIILAVAVIPAGAAVRLYVGEMLAQPRREETRRAERAWAATAQKSLEECRGLVARTAPTRRPKVLVWDGSSSLSEVVNVSLRAAPGDTRLTVFWIADKKSVQLGRYTSGAGGYRTDVTVCVIDLPEGTARGTFVVQGFNPPNRIERSKYDTTDVYGDWRQPLGTWIQNLAVE